MRPDNASSGGSSTGMRARGFTLLEVMVALVVTSIGLLGIAKLQALAYASTGSASMRSLVALQVAGLAASMHADRGYWSGNFVATPLTITGTTISDATLANTAPRPTIACSDPAIHPAVLRTLAIPRSRPSICIRMRLRSTGCSAIRIRLPRSSVPPAQSPRP